MAINKIRSLLRKATGASIVAARQPYNKIYIMDGIGVANHR